MTEPSSQNSLKDDFSELAVSVIDIATEIMGGIPVVGAALNAAKSVKNLSNTLYLRKVLRVFAEMDTGTSNEERQQFLCDLESEGEVERFGEAVVLLIDKLDDMQKPVIVGRLLSAAMRGDISRSRAIRLATVVKNSFVDDLNMLAAGVENVEGDAFLAAAGLLGQVSLTMTSTPNAPIRYRYVRSELGEDLVCYGLKPFSAKSDK